MSFQIKTQLAAYKVLITAVKAGASPSVFDSAVRSFEPLFLGNLVLVLEEMFVHRSRGIEQF